MDPRDLTKIRAFLAELLRKHDDHAAFADTESLINSGRLDSLAVVKLVGFLESAFAVDFAEVEFDPQRFDTVDEIAALVEESGARRAAPRDAVLNVRTCVASGRRAARHEANHPRPHRGRLAPESTNRSARPRHRAASCMSRACARGSAWNGMAGVRWCSRW